MFHEDRLKEIAKPRDPEAHKRHMEMMLAHDREDLMDLRKFIASGKPGSERTFKLNWDEYKPSDTIDLYDVDGTWLGPIYNDTEFAWVRLQMLKQRVTGLRIKYKGEMYDINPDGSIKGCPDGLGSETYNYVVEIINEKREIGHEQDDSNK